MNLKTMLSLQFDAGYGQFQPREGTVRFFRDAR